MKLLASGKLKDQFLHTLIDPKSPSPPRVFRSFYSKVIAHSFNGRIHFSQPEFRFLSCLSGSSARLPLRTRGRS
jgi:hypothetical protein